ncbi:MAG: hypothetical protein SGI99_12320, partial [Pseudomonadota bacterium]|nr:hypothetical protein [Pseudomonadota bacterium]
PSAYCWLTAGGGNAIGQGRRVHSGAVQPVARIKTKEVGRIGGSLARGIRRVVSPMASAKRRATKSRAGFC